MTTFHEATNRVAMHGVPMELVERQAMAARLPLLRVPLPWPCSNQIYEERLQPVFDQAQKTGVTQFAFGDLFLDDIRSYREQLFVGTGIEPIFPIWNTPRDTAELARKMIAAGFQSILTCTDTSKLSPNFCGRQFDEQLLADLPESIDPCGEHGEFHTFCHAGPIFQHPIEFRLGDRTERDRFCFSDILA